MDLVLLLVVKVGVCSVLFIKPLHVAMINAIQYIRLYDKYFMFSTSHALKYCYALHTSIIVFTIYCIGLGEYLFMVIRKQNIKFNIHVLCQISKQV